MNSKELEKLFKKIKKDKIQELTKKDAKEIVKAPVRKSAMEHYYSEFHDEFSYNDKIGILGQSDHFGYVFFREFIRYTEIQPDYIVAIIKAKEEVKTLYESKDLEKKQWIFDLLNEEAIRKLALTAAYRYYDDNFTKIHSKEKECVPDKLYWELENGVDSSVIKEIFNFLQENRGFISPDTEFKQFKKVFTNHDKDKNFTGISWIKPVNYLYYFVRHMKNQKIIKKVNCMYEVAAHLFTENGKNLSAIQIKSNTKPNDTIEEAFINFLSKHK